MSVAEEARRSADAPADAGPERSLASVLSAWLPCFAAVIAAGLCLFSMSWWISRAPHGGARLGVVTGLASADSLVWVLVLARTLDRSNRYRSALCLTCVIAAPVCALLVIFGYPAVGVAVIGGGLCYLAVHLGQTLYEAATENMVADLAPAYWPTTRTAMISQVPEQIGAMVAPAIGGVLIAIGALHGVAITALITLACCLTAVFLLRGRFRQMDASAQRARQAGTSSHGVLTATFHDAMSSVKLVRQHPELVYIIVLGILGNLVMFPFYAVLAAFTAEYDISRHAQVLLYSHSASAYAFGLLLSTLAAVKWRNRFRTRTGLAIATAAFALVCVFVIGATLIPDPLALIVAMVLCGLMFSVLMSVAGSVWLDRTPADVRIRVFALRRLVTFSSIPLGTMLMGFGGAALGYHQFSRLLAGAVLLCTVAWWVAFQGRIRNATADEQP